MSIQEWFCICLFLKLYGSISNVPLTSYSALDDTERKALSQKIEDLIQKLENSEDVKDQVEGPFAEEELPEEVVMTQGHCTVLEYIKSWVIPGYQPEVVGTQTNPLIQHKFKRVNLADGSISAYGALTLAPTQTPYVKEPSRYLTSDQVKKLKKGADKIIQDIRDSPKKVKFA